MRLERQDEWGGRNFTGSTVLCLPVLRFIERMFKIMYTALYSLQLCVILYRHVLEISMPSFVS